MKTCTKCNITRDFSFFYKKGGGREGFRAICKICNSGQNKNARSLQDKVKVSTYNKAYKAANMKKLKEVGKKYRDRTRKTTEGRLKRRREQHLRRNRTEKQLGVFPNDYWEILIGVFGEQCLRCGSIQHLQLDHIIPLSKNGLHCMSNFQILCKTCNISKGNRSSKDYRPFLYSME